MSILPGPDRTLPRMLRKQPVAAHVAFELDRLGPGHGISDSTGKLLAGEPGALEAASGAVYDVIVDDRLIGRAHGPDAAGLARLLQVLALQDVETRALAQESLDRYKELSLLYSLSDKFVGAPDAAGIATMVCNEAVRFLDCDSAAVLLLNPGTGRLETLAMHGVAFHDRSSRDVGQDIVASVLTSGIGEIVNDVASDARLLQAASALTSVVCCPLKANDHVLGVLIAGSRAERQFNASDLQALGAMAAQTASAIEVTRLDRDLSASSRKPVNLIYAVDDRPPIGIAAMLGVQHVLVAVMSLAYPVLVTLEAGGSRLLAASVVSMSLLAMAVATLLQQLRHGHIGSGYFAPYITSVIFIGPSLLAARAGGLGLVFGMTIFAGFVALGLSQLIRRFRKLFPPEVSGVVVLMVGLSMMPVALPRFMGLGGNDTLSEPREWLVGLVTLAIIVGLSVLPLGKVRLYSTAVGITAGYGLAAALGMFDLSTFEQVKGLPALGLLPPPIGIWRFDVMLIMPFVVASLASSMKEAGLLISCQKSNDAHWIRPDTRSLSGGLNAGGLGNIVCGAVGGVGLGIGAGNVGLASATGATSRSIGVLTAGLFMLLAFMPQATAMLALIPSPVMGAGLIYVACHLVASGAELITSRMLDARRNYVVGLSLLAGVGLMAAPGLFANAPEWALAVFGSPLALSTIMALLLNLVLNVGVSTRARFELNLDASVGKSISDFLERQGATWGARGELIGRAVPALTEWAEDVRAIGAASRLVIELQYDEFNLVVTVRPVASGSGPPVKSSDEIRAALEPLSRTIAQRYDCSARLVDGQNARFDFEN